MLGNLHAVVGDEAAMREKIRHIRGQIIAEGRAEQAEVVAFLEWLANNHYLFMGFCEYDLITDAAGEAQLQVVEGSGLGILANRRAPAYSSGFAALNAADKKTWLEAELVRIDDTMRRSLWMFFILVGAVGVTVSWPLLAG